VTYLPVNSAGRVSLDDLKSAIRGDTILITIMTANNEIGTIRPLKRSEQLHGKRASCSIRTPSRLSGISRSTWRR
jgi:cysteine desulfurase